MQTIQFKRYLLGEINTKYTDEEIEKIPEEIYRDLYLRKIHTGEIQGPLTGNVFLDKPWVTNFLDTPVQKINVEDTLYKNHENANQDNLDGIAVYEPTTGKSYTHRQLIEMRDLIAGALSKRGYSKNSRVGLLLNNSVEEPVFLLALNKLGAVQKYIDYTKDVPTIIRTVATSDFDLLVMDEMFLPLEPHLNEKGLPVIIASAKQKHEKENYVTFDELLALGETEVLEPAEYEDEKPSIIISSSGTTGPAKPIVHTDYSLNNAAFKMFYTDYSLSRKNVLMKIIPPQIGLGLITSLYTNLVAGTQIAMIKGEDPMASIQNTVEFIKNFKTFRKQNNLPEDTKLVLFASPMYMRAIISDPSVDDLSFIGGILLAGSKIGEEELNGIEQIARSKGCTVPACNGYGQNEKAGAVSLNSNTHNRNGSAGYPVIGTDIRICDPKTYELLGANEEGVILERSGSSFLEYENMEEATKNARVTLPDGLEWFDSRDLGMMDETGFMSITGRLSRVFNRRDFKIPVDGIEEKIKSHPAVKDCAIVAINTGGSDDVTYAYISVYPTFNILIDDIMAQIQASEHQLSDLEFPTYCVETELPYMGAGKIDYLELIKLAKKQDADVARKRNLQGQN